MPAAMLLLSVALLSADPVMKVASFDADPGWEGVRNRAMEGRTPTVTQDFGFSPTHHAGKGTGEMGGKVQRATTPASYGDRIARTLNDKLSASGSFAITRASPGGGVFFGYFRGQQPGGGGRPIGSLGMNMDFEGKGGRIAVRLITDGNRSCGTFATPYVPGKYRPTPIRLDGTRYRWTLDYDPAGAGGNGQFTFTLRSDGHTPDELLNEPGLTDVGRKEAMIRFPKTTAFTVDLPAGYKQEGATFDRFGVMNMMKTGGDATIFFDDLSYDGKKQEFARDPRWIGEGNRGSFDEQDLVGVQNFGFSAKTRQAGGKPGEIGGSFWRGEKNFGYYADKVGPLTLEQKLEARGKVQMVVGGPDADMALGFFNSADVDEPPAQGRNFLGVKVGGPTRVGHYFNPGFTSAKGNRAKVDAGPVIKPGKVYDWSLVYDPAAEGGLGAVTVKLGEETVTLPLRKGQKAEGATFDRFGMFSTYPGGQMVKIYLDDLSYSTGAAR